jgi:medium-chain acyl-[acyl-carrier-protein] hydrolase
MAIRDPWFAYYQPNKAARLKLFCLPYAGGSASIFRLWGRSLPADIEVMPVQYPGREGRIMEKPFDRVETLVDTLLAAIRPHLNDKPFAFYGHSLGGLTSFVLARRLRREGLPMPVHLFVSGFRAPQLPDCDPPIHHLAEPEFISELRRLNGTPEAVLENKELIQLLLPTLRADFAAAETYQYTEDVPLGCSITALGGLEDPEVTEADMTAWQTQTTNRFRVLMLPGDHFFLHNSKDALLAAISQDLNRL